MGDTPDIRNRITEVRKMRLGNVAHNPQNWRGHPSGQRQAFQGVVREIGWAGMPLVYHSERTGVLTYVDGHMRKEELPDLEADVAITDLDDAEADLLLAAYDPLAAMAEANREKLGVLLQDVQSDEAAVQEMLSELAEREGVVFGGNGQPPEDPGPQVDRSQELAEQWGTALGQVWELGEHRLVCGDCTDPAVVEAVMRGERIKAVITDPPYGINWDTDYTRFTTAGFDVPNKKHDRIEGDDKPFDPRPFFDFETVVLWGANFYPQHLPIGTWLIWDKRFENGEAFLSDAELAWMKSGYGVYIFSLTSQGCIRPERVQHPTQKPVALFEWCIEKSKAGEFIYDPFLGSGSTLIACQNLNRKCRACDIVPAHVAVALQRWRDLTGLDPKRID